MIVFLSDGYVGNEAEILRMVADNIGRAHTYVLGVGTGVNRYLLAEMAHQGRGFMRIIDPTEDREEAAVAFAKKFDMTVMTIFRSTGARSPPPTSRRKQSRICSRAIL